MKKNNAFRVLVFFVAVLILSKLFNFYHFAITDSFYLDVDRLIALLLFVAFVHLKLERIKIDAISTLLLGLGLCLLLNEVFQVVSMLHLLVLFFLTSMVEEILLRAVLFELLLIKLSPILTLMLTSVFFVVIHPHAWGSPLYGFLVLLTGVILGGSYLFFRRYNKSLAVSIGTTLHCIIILLGLAWQVIP